MRKAFVAICVALWLLFSFFSVAQADEITKTLTFQWEQHDKTNLKEWRLYWSESAGGPYDSTPIAVIPYDPASPGPTYQSPADAKITGTQATHIVKYFVLVACGDIPQADGSTKYGCSDNSNEVSYDFWIPAGKFSVPIKFLITTTPN